MQELPQPISNAPVAWHPTLVEWIYQVAREYFDALFPEPEQAREVMRALFATDHSEIAVRRVVAFQMDGQLVGMHVIVPGDELRAARLSDARHIVALVGRDVFKALAGRIQAMSSLFVVPQPTDLYLSKIMVHPSYRRVGIGRHILEHVEDQARESGCHRVVFDVFAGNIPAVHFYVDRGYRQIGQGICESARDPDGAPLSYLHFAKEI